MKDYIFIIGPSAVGKTTLAKSLYNHYKGVYIEQNMMPEFNIPKNVDEGIFEEKICWENTLEQIKFFHNKGFKNIIALDFDDLRTREIPKIFKGTNFITLKLISSNPTQIKEQMIKRHNEGTGLFDLENVMRSNEVISKRPLLPNERIIDICGKSANDVLQEAILIIDEYKSIKNYEYKLPNRNLFLSWVKSNNLR